MKSNWRVTSNVINGKTMFGVYRLLDTKETDHSGNREHQHLWTADRRVAEGLAETLNQAETLNLADRHKRLDAWLRENCDEYLGDGKCELMCAWQERRSDACCYMGCQYAKLCAVENALCDIVDLPKEFREEETE